MVLCTSIRRHMVSDFLSVTLAATNNHCLDPLDYRVTKQCYSSIILPLLIGTLIKNNTPLSIV